MTFAIETWRFIEERFAINTSLGTFPTEAAAVAAMWAAIHASGKDMSRFRVVPA